MASSSSFSSSVSSLKGLKETFYEALAENTAAGSIGSSKLDYLDSFGSRTPRGTADPEYPEPTACLNQSPQGTQYTYTTVVHADESEDGSDVQEVNLEQLREFRQKQVLFIIAIHLILLSVVDFSLQILLVHCGNYCPSPTVLFRLELGVVILFPCSALLFLKLATCCKSSGAALVLMSSYSILFALFFFGVCDMMLGPTKAHRDIALILFTLTVTFILFSLYVYSKDSPKCLYLALAVLTLTVVSTFGLLLAFPTVLDRLPHKLEAVFAPNRTPAKASIWVSYGMAFTFAIGAVSLTTLMFTALRGFIFERNHSSLDDRACSTAVEVLLRMEMFFIVLPFELISRLGSRCLPSRS